jgi:hypothetical protein
MRRFVASAALDGQGKSKLPTAATGGLEALQRSLRASLKPSGLLTWPPLAKFNGAATACVSFAGFLMARRLSIAPMRE